MAEVPNINDLLDALAVLGSELIDRIRLNAHVPNLQAGGRALG